MENDTFISPHLTTYKLQIPNLLGEAVETKVTVTDQSDNNKHETYIQDPTTYNITEHPGPSQPDGDEQLPALVSSSGSQGGEEYLDLG